MRDIDGARLANDRNLDLTRILQLPLDLACDFVAEQCSSIVIDLFGLDHYPDLAPGLHRVAALHPALGGGDLLQRLQALDVVLRLSPRPPGRDAEIASAEIARTASTVWGSTS